MLQPGGTSTHPDLDLFADAFVQSCKVGHTALVFLLLECGVNVNCGRGRGLIAAAKEGRSEVVEVLLEAGADIGLCLEGTDVDAVVKRQGTGVSKADFEHIRQLLWANWSGGSEEEEEDSEKDRWDTEGKSTDQSKSDSEEEKEDEEECADEEEEEAGAETQEEQEKEGLHQNQLSAPTQEFVPVESDTFDTGPNKKSVSRGKGRDDRTTQTHSDVVLDFDAWMEESIPDEVPSLEVSSVRTRKKKAVDYRRAEKPIHLSGRAQGNFLADTWTEDDVTPLTAALHKELTTLVRRLQPSEEEERIRRETFRRYQTLIPSLLSSEYSVNLFGSSATQMCLAGGDLDITVISSGDIRKEKTLKWIPRRAPKELYTVAESLRRIGSSLVEDVQVIPAKVPIIKFVDVASGLNVDMSFGGVDALRAVETVRALNAEFPQLRPIVLFLKTYLQNRQLYGVPSGGLGGYALVVWVAAYLRAQKRLSRKLLSSESQPTPDPGGDPWVTSPSLLGNGSLGNLLLQYLFVFGKQSLEIRSCKLSLSQTHAVAIDFVFGGSCQRGPTVVVADPLRSSNNLVVGSWRMPEILKSLGEAYDSILEAWSERRLTLGNERRESEWPLLKQPLLLK
ncbi:hypothetical protein HK102_012946 [Quaeritorhiza haematococci]|nr:hypothetical protein HK102_012946 [Quaeritorhiza haematococci]